MNYPLAIVVPILNEIDCIDAFLQQFLKQKHASISYQVVIVDNGSTDGTLKRVREFMATHAGVKIILTNEEKKGIQHATRKGFDIATGSDILVKLDADSLISQTFICDVWNSMQGQNIDALIGKLRFPWEIYINLPVETRSVYISLVKKRKRLNALVRRWYGNVLSGPFYAITRASYETIGGIHLGRTVVRYHDDIELGLLLTIHKQHIVQTDIQIDVSPRRFQENLEAYITGSYYWGKQIPAFFHGNAPLEHSEPPALASKEKMMHTMVTIYADIILRLAAYTFSNFLYRKKLVRVFNAACLTVPRTAFENENPFAIYSVLKKAMKKRLYLYLAKYT